MDYMFEEKRIFIEKLTEALKVDKRSQVEAITYYPPNFFEKYPNGEFIRIQYNSELGNGFVWINATANSDGANAKEIVAEVYGNGAIGRMFGACQFEEAIKK
jgi:hypothetical protein